jgi:hypothetical protein
MPANNNLLERLTITFLFACTYFLFYMAQIKVMEEFEFLPMASILFLPAGVKFLAMLIGQGAGVAGIIIGVGLVNQFTGETQNLLHMHPYALLVWILLPYVLLRAYLNKRGHGQHLNGLTTFDVVVLVIMVSFVSSIGAQLYWNGLDSAAFPLLRAIWGMFLGDISGIFLMLGLVILTRRVFSRAAGENKSKQTTP